MREGDLRIRLYSRNLILIVYLVSLKLRRGCPKRASCIPNEEGLSLVIFHVVFGVSLYFACWTLITLMIIQANFTSEHLFLVLFWENPKLILPQNRLSLKFRGIGMKKSLFKKPFVFPVKIVIIFWDLVNTWNLLWKALNPWFSLIHTHERPVSWIVIKRSFLISSVGAYFQFNH